MFCYCENDLENAPIELQERGSFNFEPCRMRAHWIGPGECVTEAALHTFTLDIECKTAVSGILRVAADERYEFYCDGVMRGRGNCSGDFNRWYMDKINLALSVGRHRLIIRVACWGIAGEAGPLGRISLRPALLVAGDATSGDLVTTGTAPWRCQSIPLTVIGANAAVYCCELPPLNLRAAERPAILLQAGRLTAAANEYALQLLLEDSPLPPMHGESVRPTPVTPDSSWAALLVGNGVLRLEAGTQARVVLSFPDYCCCFYRVEAGGTGRIKMRWAEAVFADGVKGNRNEIIDSEFCGLGDDLILNGCDEQRFESLFWFAGRYLELTLEAGEEPLILRELSFTDTHYPISFNSRFDCGDPRYAALTPLLLRTLELCTHDIFMDCPYYERLMYIGDTRIEALVLMNASADTRPVINALNHFAASRDQFDLPLSRYPARVKQRIPTYSLIFILMVHDYALYRNDVELVSQLLPRIRTILAYFLDLCQGNGILPEPPGWNFMDWATGWSEGEAPRAKDGVSCTVNLLFVQALMKAAALENYCGETQVSMIYRNYAMHLKKTVRQFFYDSGRGLYADDSEHRHFSEHAQALAILADEKVDETQLCASDLTPTTVYFSHYWFEMAYKLKRPDLFFPRLNYWFALPRQGFKTIPERPEPSRSDCHAWGSHPYYHFLATILGIRPSAFEFRRIAIVPMPGAHENISGTLPHPRGVITTNITGEYAEITIPEGTDGEFRYRGMMVPLVAGTQQIHIPRISV